MEKINKFLENFEQFFYKDKICFINFFPKGEVDLSCKSFCIQRFCSKFFKTHPSIKLTKITLDEPIFSNIKNFKNSFENLLNNLNLFEEKEVILLDVCFNRENCKNNQKHFINLLEFIKKNFDRQCNFLIISAEFEDNNQIFDIFFKFQTKSFKNSKQINEEFNLKKKAHFIEQSIKENNLNFNQKLKQILLDFWIKKDLFFIENDILKLKILQESIFEEINYETLKNNIFFEIDYKILTMLNCIISNDKEKFFHIFEYIFRNESVIFILRCLIKFILNHKNYFEKDLELIIEKCFECEMKLKNTPRIIDQKHILINIFKDLLKFSF